MKFTYLLFLSIFFTLPINGPQTTNFIGLGLADTSIIPNGTVIDDISYDGWRFNGFSDETGIYPFETSLTNNSSTQTRFYTSDGSTFKFVSIDYLIDTFGSPANVNITFYGFKNGFQIETQSFNAADTSSGTWTLNWDSVDEVKFAANSNFIFMDNLKVDSDQTLFITEETEKKSISIYPNPSKKVIKITGTISQENYKIFNVRGAKIKSGIISNQQNIDIIDLANGLYFLKFDNGNTIKFIKK